MSANPVRGEAALRVGGAELVVRPSFQALVAAEGELGPLFELVERAGEGKLSLAEAAALIWHCLREVPAMVARMYAGLDRKLWPAAARSVLAHLYDLRGRGLVREEGETWTIAA